MNNISIQIVNKCTYKGLTPLQLDILIFKYYYKINNKYIIRKLEYEKNNQYTFSSTYGVFINRL